MTMADRIDQQVRGRRSESDHHGQFVYGSRREPHPVDEHPIDGEVQIAAGGLDREREKEQQMVGEPYHP